MEFGNICPRCGKWIAYNEFHSCYPTYPRLPSNYDYKCPCRGEFNTPARDDGMKASCPFCGKEMKGII